MKKLILKSSAVILTFFALTSCTAKGDVLNNAGLNDFVKASSEEKSYNRNCTVYKMTKEKYHSYMGRVYEYLKQKGYTYIGIPGSSISYLPEDGITYQFLSTSSLEEHHIEGTDSYNFVVGRELDENNFIVDDLFLSFSYEEDDEYPVKRMAKYNEFPTKYQYDAAIDRMYHTDTRRELSELISEFYSNDLDSEHSILYHNFKYQESYSKNITYASFSDPALPLTFTFDALPTSTTLIKSTDYQYSEMHSMGYGAANIPVDYYFILTEDRKNYIDLKNRTEYLSEVHYEDRFQTYGEESTRVISYENHSKGPYKEKDSSDISNNAYSKLQALNYYYISLTNVEKILDQSEDISYKDGEVHFELKESYLNYSEKHNVEIIGSINLKDNRLIYSFKEEYFSNEMPITDVEYTVSFEVSDKEYSIVFDKSVYN